MVEQPILTIAIPTYGRAIYLESGLRHLRHELQSVPAGSVEVVSDNCSPDNTPDVVRAAVAAGMPINYVRNTENLGWARNFAQAFDRASGAYVLMMGDDDLLVPGALSLILERLESEDAYGVVCLRPYGFDEDFIREHPGGGGRERVFADSNDFLVAISPFFTLTSACVLDKRRLADVDVREFIDTDLATFHLLLRAALAADRNLYVSRYLVASKRQNSFSYEYANVFVRQFWRIIDAQVKWGLRRDTVRRLERAKLLSYYPFYLFDLRASGRGDLAATSALLQERFGRRWLFRLWVQPTLRLPRPFALVWGAATTTVGRVLNGDLRRGLTFARHKVFRLVGVRYASDGSAQGASAR